MSETTPPLVEDYISNAKASRLFPGHPSPGTVWRWADKGILIRGQRLKLQSIRVGGRIFTTAAWVETFQAAQASDRNTIVKPIIAPTVRRVSSSRRQRQIADAKLELALSDTPGRHRNQHTEQQWAEFEKKLTELGRPDLVEWYKRKAGR